MSATMMIGEPPQPSGDGEAQRLKVWIESIPLRSGSVIKPVKCGVTAIVGANNCGKTTLLSEVNTFLTNPAAVPSVEWKVSTGSVDVRHEGSRDDLLAWLNLHANWGMNQYDSNGPAFRRENRAFNLGSIDRWETESNSDSGFWIRHFPPESYGQPLDAERLPVGTAPSAPTQVFYEQPELLEELSTISKRIFNRSLYLDDESNNHRLLVDRPKVPRPAQGEDRRAYRAALANMETLAEQGHGMRSWLSIITHLIVGTYPIVLADEPEIFLHPPLARSLGTYLGELAKQKGSQVILATHDRNLLAGLLEASETFSVVRLVRTAEGTGSYQLEAQQVSELWTDPVLRYSDVLDGLFHQAVVVAEAHGDCTFYRAAGDHHDATRAPSLETDIVRSSLRVADVMFVPSNGKQGMPRFVRALEAVRVPVVTTPDFDVLDPKDPALENIVKAMGGNWIKIKALLMKATESLARPSKFGSVKLVSEVASKEFEKILEKDPDAIWDHATKTGFNSVLRVSDNPSKTLQERGIDFAAGQERRYLDDLLAELAAIGIVPVHVGDLEKFDRTVDQKNKTKWLEVALTRQTYKNQDAQMHIARCVEAADEKCQPSSTQTTD